MIDKKGSVLFKTSRVDIDAYTGNTESSIFNILLDIIKSKPKNQKRDTNRFEYMKPFAEQLKDFMDKEHRAEIFGNDGLLLGSTPKVLQDIGLPKLPVMIDQKHVSYALEGTYGNEKYRDQHIFDMDEFSKLPEKLADPIAIIADPSTGDLVVYIDMQNKADEQTIVPIRIESRGQINGITVDLQRIKSAHGRNDSIANLKAAIQKDRNDAIRLYYLNKERSLTVKGVDVLNHGHSLSFGIIHRITDPGSPVKPTIENQTDTRQFKHWFGKSKAVNSDGSPKVFYHGTPNGTFSEFRGWQYFTESKEYANVYQGRGASSNGYKKTALNPKTYEVYLRAEKPFDTRNPAERKIFMNEFYQKWGNGAPLSDRNLPDWTGGDDLIEFLEENGYDYDSIVLDEGGTGGYDQEVNDRGISWVIRDSNQIKSATDNIGTFDPENPDIRYQRRDIPAPVFDEQSADTDKKRARLGSLFLHKTPGILCDARGRKPSPLQPFLLFDIQEVFIGVDGEFAACRLITRDDCIVVQLQSRAGPFLTDAALDGRSKRACLVMARDQNQHLLGVGDCADADRQGLSRYLFGVVAKEAGVDNTRIGSQIAHAGTGVQRGIRLIERQMTVHTDAAHEQVDSAVKSDLLLVVGAFLFGIVGHAVQNVDVLRLHIDEVVEEVVVHEVPIALIVLMRKAEVFVHVEGNDVFETDLTRFVHANKLLINADRAGTGRKAENKRTILFVRIDFGRDVCCSPLAHFIIIVLNDNSHGKLLI